MTVETVIEGMRVVWGPPGCGKTTYLAQKTRDFCEWASLWHPENRHPVLLCSLTRTAAAEIAGRDLPLPRESVGTLHSHAYRSLGCPKVAETLVDDFNKSHPAYRLSGAEIDTENPEWDRRTGTPGDEMSNEYHLLRARMTDRRVWPARALSFANKWESWKQDTGAIDFTDMIELAWREVDFAPGNPLIVIADEAQDLSSLEYSLLKRWGQAAGNLIITGDPYQALYVWRGAHPEVFLDKDIDDDHRRVLSQSYRVPRAVHRAAMKWVGQLSNFATLNYQPREHEGAITTTPASWKAPDKAIDLAERYLSDGKSVMFAASCSFFLTPLVATLRRRGLPFSNPWRAKRGDWNPLGGKGVTMARRVLAFLRADCATFGADARQWTFEELLHWMDVLQSKGLMLHGAKQQMETWAAGENGNELAPWESLFELMAHEHANELFRLLQLREEADESVSIADLLTWWQSKLLTAKAAASKFPIAVAAKRGATALTEPPKLYVGTMHSFKGAEADVVFLFPDLSPSGYREWNRRGESRDGVVRLFYVGLTRAREAVVLCAPAGTQLANLFPLLN